MTAGDFVMPPALQGEPSSRFPLILEGDPGWTDTNFSLGVTRPGDSAVNAGLSDKKTGAVKLMPLTPAQARRAGMELIIRADLIDPNGAAS